MGDDNPGGRIARGNAVLAATKTVKTAPIAKRLSDFAAVHKRYLAAEADVRKASAALEAQQRLVGEGDVAQDAAVEVLAAALVGDGFPRINPFKPLGFVSPGELQRLGYAAEAKEALGVANAVTAHARTGKASKASAKALASAARTVVLAIAPIAAKKSAHTDALTKREAISQAWETAFAGLKIGAQSAEIDGAKGLVNALFGRLTRARKAKAQKAPTGSGAPPAPTSTQPPAPPGAPSPPEMTTTLRRTRRRRR